jgi:hypothetical protein
MFKVKIALLSLATVIVVSAIGVPNAMAFKAFQVKAKVGQLKGKQTAGEGQIFKTQNGEFKCGAVAVSGHALQLEDTTLKLAFKETNCTAFLLAATLSEAKYNFTVNGEVELENEMIWKASGCEIKIPGSQKFGTGSAIYENSGQNLKIKYSFKGITYTGNGSTCPNSGSDGVLSGSVTIEGDNPPATISVH